MVDGRTALLLLDLQRDFLADDGRMPVARDQVAGLVEAVNRLAAFAAAAGWPVAGIVNEFSPWDIGNLFRYQAAIRGRPGAAPDPRIVAAVDRRFAKSRPDAFSNPGLAPFLRSAGVVSVAIAGVFAEGCVAATARGARRAGFRPLVVADAVAGGGGGKVEAALAGLRRAGIAIAVAQAVMDGSALAE